MAGNVIDVENIKSGEQLDYLGLLFKQIERVLLALQTGNGDLSIQSVETLEALVCHYEDKDFDKELKKINESFNKEIPRIRMPNGQLDQNKLNSMNLSKSRAIFKLVIRLVGRKGMLPAETIEMFV